MKTKDLQKKYWLKNIWWNIWVKRVMNTIAWIWGISVLGSLVSFPLSIDIHLGTMREYYFKYGFKAVFSRCWTYNEVLVSRLNDKEKEEDLRFFGMTEKAKEKAEIDIELNQIEAGMY